MIRCLHCDYVLVEPFSTQCPECGREFDPSDANTVNVSGRSMRHARRFLRPVGWPTSVMAIVALGLPLWIGRSPGREFHAGMASALLWCIALAVWSMRLLGFFVLMRVFSRSLQLGWQDVARWILAPTLFVVVCVLPGNAGRRIAFWFSHSSLDALVQQTREGRVPTQSVQWAGLYHVTVAAASPEEVRLFTGYGYDGDMYGFAYHTGACPQDTFWIRYQRLGGNWYEYAERVWTVPPASAPTSAAAPE